MKSENRVFIIVFSSAQKRLKFNFIVMKRHIGKASESMELYLRFIPNAFKHGVTEDEIWEVFLNKSVKCIILKYKKCAPEIIYNAYGMTEDGRYLEIGYVKENNSLFRVIHAMDMRESSKKRFKKIRRIK